MLVTMVVRKLLKDAAVKLKLSGISSASLDAEVLLMEAMRKNKYDAEKISRSWLYAHDDYILNKDTKKMFFSFIRQRLRNKPTAYIINRKEFYGYDFYVDENVLIPRPETELIVEEVLEIVSKRMAECFDLIDVGTGSGCIIISILNKMKENGKDEIVKNCFAIDISRKAIGVAKINAYKYGLKEKIKFMEGDIEKAIGKKFLFCMNNVIITANLPYIKNSDYRKLSRSVRKYEPKMALDGGKEGLFHIRRLINKISDVWLRFKGKRKISLVLEADPRQMGRIRNITSNELDVKHVKTVKDLGKKERIIIIES